MADRLIVVNLFAGGGAGKSTLASHLFAHLKMDGVNCELVTEFPKDCVWERHWDMMDDQIAIFGEQQRRLRRLQGKVQLAITDSPLLLSALYDKHQRRTLRDLVVETFNEYDNMNYFLKRPDGETYEQIGRVGDGARARQKDKELRQMFELLEIQYDIYNRQNAFDHIMFDIQKKLRMVK